MIAVEPQQPEKGNCVDYVRLLRVATAAAKRFRRRHSVLTDADDDDITSGALQAYVEADAVDLKRYADPAQFVNGAARKIALRMAAHRKRERVAAQCDGEGETAIDWASHTLEPV